MATPRDFPYIWTTWLPRLLTGENSCEWAAWFKAHYQNWTRQPSSFDQAEWLMRHTALLNQQRQEWESNTRTVFVESQNAFRLQCRTATLGGRPDLVVLDERDATIIDVKTGREQPWHVVQVMIYMYAVPKALERYKQAKLSGQVTYRDHTVRIPAGAVDERFVQNLGALIRRLSADEPARRVPSRQECRFCDVSAADCPERVDERLKAEEGTTDHF